MLKKTLLIFTIFTAAILLKACCKDEPRYFRYTGMKVAHKVELWAPAAGDLIVDTGQKYFINIDFDVEYLAHKTLDLNTGFLFNTAYASRCKSPGYEGSKEDITKIYVTSNARFDSVHAGGQNLNHFFRIYEYHNQQHKLLSPENIWFSPVSSQGFRIILAQKPALDSVHTFTVHVELSNGKSFIAQTPSATFRR